MSCDFRYRFGPSRASSQTDGEPASREAEPHCAELPASGRRRHRCLWGIGGLVVICLGVLTQVSNSNGDAPAAVSAEGITNRSEATREDELGLRLREGSELREAVGEFQKAGERIRFRPADRQIKLTVLENLALERVSRVLEETRTPPLWSVSGTITEFHGSNYLLITRAVVKAKPQEQ